MDSARSIDREEVRQALDKFYGQGRWANDHANPCYGDGYYALSLKQKYGKDIEALVKMIGYSKPEL